MSETNARRTGSHNTRLHLDSASPAQSRVYTIRIRGHLDLRWSEWFDGMTITHEANGDSTLSGPVADQAALHGLLVKVRDLGLPLISVNRAEPGPE